MSTSSKLFGAEAIGSASRKRTRALFRHRPTSGKATTSLRQPPANNTELLRWAPIRRNLPAAIGEQNRKLILKNFPLAAGSRGDSPSTIPQILRKISHMVLLIEWLVCGGASRPNRQARRRRGLGWQARERLRHRHCRSPGQRDLPQGGVGIGALKNKRHNRAPVAVNVKVSACQKACSRGYLRRVAINRKGPSRFPAVSKGDLRGRHSSGLPDTSKGDFIFRAGGETPLFFAVAKLVKMPTGICCRRGRRCCRRWGEPANSR